VGTRLGTQEDAPVGVWMVDAVPLMRYAMAGLLACSEGLRWSGGTGDMRQLPSHTGPGVLLVDSACDPNLTGTASVAGHHPTWTVLVLLREQHCTRRGVRAAQQADVDGILPRTVEPRALVTAIHRAHHSPRYLDPELGRLVTAGTPGAPECLSTRELEVLTWLCH